MLEGVGPQTFQASGYLKLVGDTLYEVSNVRQENWLDAHSLSSLQDEVNSVVCDRVRPLPRSLLWNAADDGEIELAAAGAYLTPHSQIPYRIFLSKILPACFNDRII